nr:hypothetical protein CFP56_27892 [Quercus suber]
MTTRFNKARYAKLKQKVGEEAQPGGSLQSKRRCLKKCGDSEKPPIPSAVQKVSEVLSSFPTMSIEELTPSFRSFKGRDKGKSVFDFWNDLGWAVARAHDVISTDKLGYFSSIESRDLFTQRLQKNVQLKTAQADLIIEKTLSAQKDDHLEKAKKEVEEAVKNFKAFDEYSDKMMVEYADGF